MPIRPRRAVRQADQFEMYGLNWGPHTNLLHLELVMIEGGGRWKMANGQFAGKGLEYHYKTAASMIWPDLKWNEWNELFLREWLSHRYVGVLGPTNSGKTNSAAWCHLLTWYAMPTCSTVMVCSTTRERLEDRIWGEIKKLHKVAKQRCDWLPGHLIEGKQRIILDDRDEIVDGRDFRNGLCGVPCKKGDKYVGLGDFIGIKNKYVYLCGDELQLLPKAFIDSLSNMMKGSHRKATGLGNPAETTDSLGLLCEPAANLGGWDGGIDQTPKTKTWATRWPDGVCIQFAGSDSPNNKVPEGQPVPYPFLISRADMAADAAVWGVDDWHYTMFNEGRMPRGQGSRRFMTRNFASRHGAMMEPVWRSSVRTKLACLDAAYRGTGGDRCVFAVLEFGEEAPLDPQPGNEIAQALISQDPNRKNRREILSLVSMDIIQISGPTERGVCQITEEVEDQIVHYVMAHCAELKIPPQNFFYDSGMRTSLVQAFDRLWSTAAQSIDFGGAPSERKVSENLDVICKDYYSKFVTELWWSVRLVVEAGQFRGMTEEVLSEFCQREWKTVMGNKIEAESKKEMKLKTGRSPDLADCLACGVEGARRLGFRIKSLSELNPRKPADMAWKRELRDQSREYWQKGQLNYRA